MGTSIFLSIVVCTSLAFWPLYTTNVKCKEARNVKHLGELLFVAIMIGTIPGLIIGVVAYMLINYGFNW
jgi:hypothetical protein